MITWKEYREKIDGLNAQVKVEDEDYYLMQGILIELASTPEYAETPLEPIFEIIRNRTLKVLSEFHQ